MGNNVSLRVLAVGGGLMLSVGIVIVLYTWLSWPSWDGGLSAALAADALGVQMADSALIEPAYPERWAWIWVGAVLALVGLFATILSLFASALMHGRTQPAA